MKVLGYAWLINGILSIFIVEIDENTDRIENAEPLPDDEIKPIWHHSAMKANRTSASRCLFERVKRSITHHASIMKKPGFLWFAMYGFLHFGPMMGIVAFMPILLAESLVSSRECGATLLELSSRRVATALAVFGAGGVIGDLIFGVVMTFGPLSNHHYAVFTFNNITLIVSSGTVLLGARKKLYSRICPSVHPSLSRFIGPWGRTMAFH